MYLIQLFLKDMTNKNGKNRTGDNGNDIFKAEKQVDK